MSGTANGRTERFEKPWLMTFIMPLGCKMPEACSLQLLALLRASTGPEVRLHGPGAAPRPRQLAASAIRICVGLTGVAAAELQACGAPSHRSHFSEGRPCVCMGRVWASQAETLQTRRPWIIGETRPGTRAATILGILQRGAGAQGNQSHVPSILRHPGNGTLLQLGSKWGER